MAPKSKEKAAPFDGLIIIDKPTGMTSHDVVSRLRRILRTKKIGHTGTLDPFATGVLVMLVGKGTRLARYLDKDVKSYRATVRFGFETDTGDREGTQKDTPETAKVPSNADLLIRINTVIPEFTGEIEQVPPMYSAKKVDGKKLYELARVGIEVERNPVGVVISELSAVADEQLPENEIFLDVTSSAGTYIRTLAEDIGKRIGVPCHLAELRRTRAGRFQIEDSITLDQLEELADKDLSATAAVSMNSAVSHLPERRLDSDDAGKISHGQEIEANELSGTNLPVRLVFGADELVAIGEVSETVIRPKLVLNAK